MAWQLALARWNPLDIIPSRLGCGCSSVVEHLLAKEDVASSSLVTRSSLRLERSGKRRLERHAVAKRRRAPLYRLGAPRLQQAYALLLLMMFYVYILVSEADPSKHYTGVTGDLYQRLGQHNRGECVPTAKFRPWRIETAISFRSEQKAIEFEKYPKSGSGREFARRHF